MTIDASSSSPADLVTEFHETYGLPIKTELGLPSRERLLLRWSLIAEEFQELTAAVYGQDAADALGYAISHVNYAHDLRAQDVPVDIVETADALGDLVYVIYGMALELGIPLDAVLAEIQRSNMSKLGGDGRPIYREDGKVLKGPNFTQPNIPHVLGLNDGNNIQ